MLDVVEDREERIVIALADRIEFVVMALRTFHRESKPNLTGGIYPVGHALETIFLFRISLTSCLWSVAMKAGGKALVITCIWQHVSCELCNGELVERHVAMKRSNNPIPIGPDLALLVVGETTRVGIAREIKPILGAAFGIVTCR